ncbi:Homeobox protein ceh-14, partial [Araneus ventricosus]
MPTIIRWSPFRTPLSKGSDPRSDNPRATRVLSDL